MADKKTSKKEASKASQVLRDPTSSKTAKQLAGSALAQSHTNKQTSEKEATIASKVLRNSSSTLIEKSLAGSALAQSKHKNKK